MATAEAQREYQRLWVARRRAAFFSGKSCIQCGSTEGLELDHTDRTTKDPVLKLGTRIWSWSEDKRAAEIAKCQILCHECHKIKSIGEVQNSLRIIGEAGTAWCCTCKMFKKNGEFSINALTGMVSTLNVVSASANTSCHARGSPVVWSIGSAWKADVGESPRKFKSSLPRFRRGRIVRSSAPSC